MLSIKNGEYSLKPSSLWHTVANMQAELSVSTVISNRGLISGPILPASEEGEEVVDGDMNEEDENAEEDEEESGADSGEEENEVEGGRTEAEDDTSEPEGTEEESLRGTALMYSSLLVFCEAHEKVPVELLNYCSVSFSFTACSNLLTTNQ